MCIKQVIKHYSVTVYKVLKLQLWLYLFTFNKYFFWRSTQYFTDWLEPLAECCWWSKWFQKEVVWKGLEGFLWGTRIQIGSRLSGFIVLQVTNNFQYCSIYDCYFFVFIKSNLIGSPKKLALHFFLFWKLLNSQEQQHTKMFCINCDHLPFQYFPG
jgi:hypothetical protein